MLRELGFDVSAGEEPHGSAVVTPETYVPGTVHLRTSVFVAGAEFTRGDGELPAIVGGSFMVAPDLGAPPPSVPGDGIPAQEQLLTMPLAERAGCGRRGPGEAVLPRSEDGANASGTANGGPTAPAAEEALLSPAPGGTLCSLGLRHVQAARVGLLVATARTEVGLGQVELQDSGNGRRLTGTATGRAVDGTGWPG